MVSKRLLTQQTLTAIALVATTGCGMTNVPNTSYNDPAMYNQMVRQQTMPTLPKGVTATSIALLPAQAAGRVGESMRFNVTIKGSDRLVYTDARLATWSLSNPQGGSVDVNGVLTPQIPGTVKVIASIAGLSAEATVQVEAARYAWQQVLSPVGTDLHTVKMVTRTEAWAGGEKGVLLRFFNGSWQRSPGFTQGDATIKGLGFANTAVGWAVGSRGSSGNTPFITRWTGAAWVAQKLPVSEGNLNAISVLSERDVWAVGQEGNGDALILHWDGMSWKLMEAPAAGKLNDVQMLSPKSGWAVGKYKGSATIPLIFKYEGGSWRKSGLWDNRGSINVTSSSELKAIKMVSETQGYAVGVSDSLLFNPRGLFLTYEPKRDGWVDGQYDASVPNLNQVPLHDIEMISGTEGWALGEIRKPDLTFERNPKSIFGNLLANKGGVLKMDTNYFSGNLTGAFHAIDLLPQGEGFVVGANGFILQRTFDWRGLNTNGTSSTGYATGTDAYGQGPSANQAMTYGPGGNTIPGGVQPARY